jgi:protoporphyrinogen oxidase
MDDADFINYAIQELILMDMIDENDVLDGFIFRMPKTYPAYFGTYDQFQLIRNFVDQYHNLFLIGRNGMHRYNNMDHSMLSAMQAVENIINNNTVKDNIWLVNAEEDYHEE